ncbi:MAG: hypothetical protein ACHQWU_08320 [Gemmatimonadales bacterium]
MRRLLVLALASTLLACGGDSLLGPVTTADGEWTGTQSGYALSLNLTQVDTSVAGSTELTGVGGSTAGTASGTFIYPTLHLEIIVPGFETFVYDGTMSTTQAKIFGKLNGSGFTNVEIDVHKR